MLSDVRTAERIEAVRLPQDGHSVRDIAAQLGVARSSVSRWVRDIPLTPDQIEALRRRNPIYNPQRNGARAIAERALLRRRAFQEAGRERVLGEAPDYHAGCALYWAEGSKSRNSVQFSNSDPAMARYFADFLRRFFGVPPEEIRLSCSLYADHAARVSEIERFWLEKLALPSASLLASTINNYSRASQRKRRNMLPYGTCRIVVHRTDIVQAIYGSIQAIGGFTRPEWAEN